MNDTQEPSGFWLGVAAVLGAVALWLLTIVAGFGGAVLAVAGIAASEQPLWWRILAVVVGSGSALSAAVIEFSQTPRRGWFFCALAGVLGAIALAVVATAT